MENNTEEIRKVLRKVFDIRTVSMLLCPYKQRNDGIIELRPCQIRVLKESMFDQRFSCQYMLKQYIIGIKKTDSYVCRKQCKYCHDKRFSCKKLTLI